MVISDFENLKSALKAIPLRDLRFDVPEYFECVFETRFRDEVFGVLNGFFGAPAKAEGEVPALAVMQSMEPYGGVRKNQTLYVWETPDVFYYAMIWPWNDRTFFSIRLERINKSS